jgi:Ca2+-binding RTX toxin-like protein
MFSVDVDVRVFTELWVVSDAASDRVVVSFENNGTLYDPFDDHLRITLNEKMTTTLPAFGIGTIFLVGGDGNDYLENKTGIPSRIFGGNGHDSLVGGVHNDMIEGQAGDDTLWGNPGDDLLEGGDGRDTLYGGNGDDLLNTGFDFVGGETALGGAGFDKFRFNFGDTTDITFPEPLIF